MKRKWLSITAAVLLLLAMIVPAQAASDYGLIYDETDFLWSEELEQLGTETMPAFRAEYDIDLRVDILTSMGSFNDLEEVAEYLYAEYGYGGEHGQNGASLTLLVHEDADGVALDAWNIYFGGESEEWTLHGPWNIPQDVHDNLTGEAWAGDSAEDTAVLAEVLRSMIGGLEGFVQSGGVAGTIWSPVTGPVWAGEEPPTELPVETPAPVEPSVPVDMPVTTAPEQETGLGYVTDAAGLLSGEELRQLEAKAKALAEQYDFGVYAVTVDDYRTYTNGDVFDAAIEIYNTFDLGKGEDRDGLILLLSMDDRDYSLVTHGDFGNYAFDGDGQAALEDFFLDDFGDDEWYAGFSDYLEWSGKYLEAAKDGTPYSRGNLPLTGSDRTVGIVIRVAVIIGVPLLVAAIVILILGQKMKSVAAATRASAYVVGNLNLTCNEDLYTHTTRTRIRVNSSSSGGKSRRSGGFSGRSGKF